MLVPVRDSKDYELFCRGELADPYPLFKCLRDEDSVHWSEPLNSWVLSRYEMVLNGLRDHQHLVCVDLGRPDGK